jgi:hypothetical protein
MGMDCRQRRAKLFGARAGRMLANARLGSRRRRQLDDDLGHMCAVDQLILTHIAHLNDDSRILMPSWRALNNAGIQVNPANLLRLSARKPSPTEHHPPTRGKGQDPIPARTKTAIRDQDDSSPRPSFNLIRGINQHSHKMFRSTMHFRLVCISSRNSCPGSIRSARCRRRWKATRS